jgi:hypothetical protein
MDDPLVTLAAVGWPAKLAAGAVFLVGVLRGAAALVSDVRTFVRPPAKSEREQLSEDQNDFLTRVMARLDAVEGKLDHCEAREAEHAQRDAVMTARFNQLLQAAKINGVEFAMDLGSIAPIPPLAPQGEKP